MNSVSGLNLKSFEEVTMGYDPFYGIVLFNGFVVQFFIQDAHLSILKFFLLISLDYLVNWAIGGVPNDSPFYLWLNQEIATTQLVEPVLFLLGIVLLAYTARENFKDHFTGTVMTHPLYDRKEWSSSVWLMLDAARHPRRPENTRIWVNLTALIVYNLSAVTFLWRTTNTPLGFVYEQDNDVFLLLGSFPWGAFLHIFYGWVIIVLAAALTFPVRDPKLTQQHLHVAFYSFVGMTHTLIFVFVLLHVGSTFFQLMFGIFAISVGYFVASRRFSL